MACEVRLSAALLEGKLPTEMENRLCGSLGAFTDDVSIQCGRSMVGVISDANLTCSSGVGLCLDEAKDIFPIWQQAIADVLMSAKRV